MDRYDYATVGISTSGDRLNITCTNTEELEALVREISRSFPKMRAMPKKDSINGCTYYYMIWDLSGREEDTQWWLIRQLCSHGWEPIGATGGDQFSRDQFSHRTHLFKQKLA